MISAASPTQPVELLKSLRPAAIVLLVQLALGALAGAVWLAWAPRTVAYVVPGVGNSTILIPDETENQIAGDGRFFVLCVIVGLIIGPVAWLYVKGLRGPIMLAFVLVGGLLSSLLARLIGETFASGKNSGAVRTAIHPPLTLHSTPMLFVQSFAAVLAYVVFAGLSSDPAFTAPNQSEASDGSDTSDAGGLSGDDPHAESVSG
ncbi:hypothetical protein ACSMXN_15965 [Jatrophihabitans sp. DSM 45814]